jgi:hypothetical protein
MGRGSRKAAERRVNLTVIERGALAGPGSSGGEPASVFAYGVFFSTTCPLDLS